MNHPLDVLASIPSPGTWGRDLRLYGIMIALGIIAAGIPAPPPYHGPRTPGDRPILLLTFPDRG